MNINLKEVFQPKLFGLFKKGHYNKQTFMSDLIAGIIVGIIALPLAIAFGIASGVTPQQGLITAIVAGFLISFFGGSNFLIGGPTGAFIVIVAGIVGQYGMQGLIIATIMAGVFLVAMGLSKMGAIFKFIPYPIVVGFTSGIALTIFSTQMKDFFGLPLDLAVPAGFIPQWGCYFQNIGSINWVEFAMSMGCLLICIFWGKVTKKIPGSLIALVLGTLVSVLLSKFAGVELATIGSKFPELANGLPMPKPVAPEFDFETIKGLVSPAFTIAILCAIESLLAAMVADGATGKKHNSNTELIGQGIANIITPMFGGIPATGALARTMASINNGGKSPVTGLIHAVVLLLIYLFLMPYAVYIPLSCLAAILVMVAYNMSEWRKFVRTVKSAPKSDIAVMVITFTLTVIFDLVVAIEVGVVMAAILFMKRMADTTDVKSWKYIGEADITPGEAEKFRDIPKQIRVFEISGPLFFAAADRLLSIESKNYTKVIVLRMRSVPAIDASAMKSLREIVTEAKKKGITVVFSHVNEQPMSVMKKDGFIEFVGEENFRSNIVEALDYAEKLV